MSIESDIQSLLAPLAAGGCYPLTGPDPVTAPYIVFSVVSDVMVNDLDGWTEQSNKRIQIDIYHTGFASVKSLAVSVISAMTASIAVNNLLLSTRDLYESDVKLYRISMDFSIWS